MHIYKKQQKSFYKHSVKSIKREEETFSPVVRGLTLGFRSFFSVSHNSSATNIVHFVGYFVRKIFFHLITLVLVSFFNAHAVLPRELERPSIYSIEWFRKRDKN